MVDDISMSPLEGIEEIRPGRRIFLRRERISSSNDRPTTAAHHHTRFVQLVWVHGLLATERQYALVLQALRTKLKEGTSSKQSIVLDCVLYDWLGCGQSPPPLSKNKSIFSKEETVRDLAAALEKYVQKDIPTILIGHSYGPSIILSALKEPAERNLVGMVWISTGLHPDDQSSPTLPPDGGHPIMKLPTIILSCLQSRLTEAFIQMAIHPDFTDIQQAVREDSNQNDMWMAKCYHTLVQFGRFQELQDLPTTLHRHLVIHGVDDGIIPLQEGQDLANQLRRRNSNGDDQPRQHDVELVAIDKASHMVLLEQPQAVADAIWGFLERIL